MNRTYGPLVILTGPTAVGKSALSIALAKAIDGEIISADSMQVYRGMDIGSAKLTREQMQGVPHHLIDILEPSEVFHVALFKQLADCKIQEIYGRGHIPILVGGTGFYIQAVLYDIDFTPNEEDSSFREELEQYARREGAQALYERLRAVDPEACSYIHANNVKRVVRALEFYHQTGQKISEHNAAEHSKKSPYQHAYFVLQDERDKLYRQIEQRVDDMMAEGLLQEVTALQAKGFSRDMVSMQGLGYKELLAYLAGECTLEEAVSIIKRDTRHFAKRQLTWFRRERDVIWIDKPSFGYDEAAMLAYMQQKIRGLRNGDEMLRNGD